MLDFVKYGFEFTTVNAVEVLTIKENYIKALLDSGSYVTYDGTYKIVINDISYSERINYRYQGLVNLNGDDLSQPMGAYYDFDIYLIFAESIVGDLIRNTLKNDVSYIFYPYAYASDTASHYYTKCSTVIEDVKGIGNGIDFVGEDLKIKVIGKTLLSKRPFQDFDGINFGEGTFGSGYFGL